MGKTESLTAKSHLLAFHAAVLRIVKERGQLGQLMPLREWNAMMVSCLDTMTRKSCDDKTWALECLGLIERKDREGVVVLDPSGARP